MVLINFNVLHGIEENHDITSYCSTMFLIPALFLVHPHFPNISTIILSKVSDYLSNVCGREVVDRGGTVVLLLLLSLFIFIKKERSST
jgi:hypothetical protein